MTDYLEVASIEEADSAIQGIVLEVMGLAAEIDYSPFLSQYTAKLEDIHEGYFEAEAGPDGEPWAPWYWRDPLVANDHPTLDATGALKGSVTTGGPGNITDITPSSLTWGTSIPYATKHLEGGKTTLDRPLVGRKGGYLRPGTEINLPQRQFLGLTESHVDELLQGVVQFVIDTLNQGSR